MNINTDSKIKTTDNQSVEIVYVIADDRDIICYRYNGKGKSFTKSIADITAKIKSGEWILSN